ncbi:MAG: type II toxin-antitoxin system HicB family antitoxin [Spirochaetaceae bacterium]|jgi:predicted RNase H-like HicB family nuclease|nr:type II toxin-antitoxin system HicB family antitoxin [Spirochaetaceae bacterium]
MKYVYPACFYPEDDGRYSVEFADFDLATFGNDLGDAVYMASDALSGRILSMLEDGEKLPSASDPITIHPDDKHAFVSLIATDVKEAEVDILNKPVRKTVKIPLWLNKAASQKHVDFSAVFKDALLEQLAM